MALPQASASYVGGFAAAATGPEDVHLFYSIGPKALVHWRLRTSEVTVRTTSMHTRLRALGRSTSIDLFVVEVLADAYKRWQWTPHGWSALPSIPVPAGTEAVSANFAVTHGEVIVAPGAQAELWVKSIASGPWVNRGGYAARTPAIGRDVVAAVSSAPDRTDVFMAWQPAALVQRTFHGPATSLGEPTRWSPWQLLDLCPGPLDGFTVLRPKDLVNFRVQAENFDVRAIDGQHPVLVAAAGARLDLTFPSQHVAEEIRQQSAARASGPSRLRYNFAKASTIRLSTESLLHAMNSHLADPMSGTPDSGVILEIPWRLLMSVHNARSVVSTAATPASDAAALWHCLIHDEDNPQTGVRVVPFALVDRDGLRETALTEADLISIVENFGTRNDARAHTLLVSSLGGSIHVSARSPSLEWTHRAAIGRDYFVQIARTGRLYPFGHRAIWVKLVARTFPAQNANVAKLTRTDALIVTEPRRRYGPSAGMPEDRRFPFREVQIVAPLSRAIKPPEPIKLELGTRVFWPQGISGSRSFDVALVSGPSTVQSNVPLLFVADEASASSIDIDRWYRPGPVGTDDRPVTVVGGDVAFIAGDRSQAPPDSIHHVATAQFGIVADTNREASPDVREMKILLPTVNRLLGQNQPIRVKIAEGFIRDPHWPVLLDIKSGGGAGGGALQLDFGKSAAKTGAVASPTFGANCLTRGGHPKITEPTTGRDVDSPAKVFGSTTATLFGVIPLGQILKSARQPEIARHGTNLLHWQQPLQYRIGPFVPGSGSLVDMTVTSSDTVTGTVKSFSIDLTIIRLDFTELRFSCTGQERPSVSLGNSGVHAVFGGDLRMLQMLEPMLFSGFSGPTISAVDDTVTIGYNVTVPSLGVGIFAIRSFTALSAVHLSLTNQPLSISVKLASQAQPFLVSISGLGGGGYLEIEAKADSVNATNGIGSTIAVIGSIEFGACAVVDFALLTAEVHVFGAVAFSTSRGFRITALLRIGGSIDLLGIVRVAIELTLALSYDSGRDSLSGSATLVIVVDITLWSGRYELRCSKEFRGQSSARHLESHVDGNAGSVEATLGRREDSYPWKKLCNAYATEG